jgi:chromosome segregation ATPase
MDDPNGLLRFIAANVETLRDQMTTLRGDVTSLRGDVTTLRGDVTILRDDVSTLRGDVTTLREDVTTLREDVTTLRDDVSTLRGDVTTLQGEMKSTRSDVARLESKMDAGFEAVRGDIERVHLRVDGIDRTVSTRLSHVENDVSRLRSVVYVLAKDQPDVLRLLGSE